MIAVYDEDVATPAYYYGYDLNRLTKDADLELSLETLKEFEACPVCTFTGPREAGYYLPQGGRGEHEGDA